MNNPADGWHIVSYSNFGDCLSTIIRSDVQFVQHFSLNTCKIKDIPINLNCNVYLVLTQEMLTC